MSSKFTCRFCKEQFDVPKGLYKHLQIAHTAGTSRDNRTCPICGVLCLKYEGYRDHLLYIHGQTDEGLKLTFKSLNEFLVWKTELELKHNCKYVLQSSPKVLPSKEKKYFYQCDRSDSKEKKDKKSVSVAMKTCSSVISVVEGINVFKVEYWDTHSGHSQTPSTQSLQNELEAAISSVEMVNAIGDSDDSYDRSEEVLVPNNSSASISNAEKPSFAIKANSPSNLNNLSNFASVKKTSIIKPSVKGDNSKKKNPNTILFSLASVACGKGIAKKPPPKIDESKDISKLDLDSSKNGIEQVDESPCNVSELQKGNSTSHISTTVAPLKTSTVLSSSSSTATTVSTSLSAATKPVSSGFPVIAPKITTASAAISSASYTTINSLINSNSAFPNQLVIVNPVGLDQNSLNSKQNILTSGQNIILSLGSPGQNAVPAVSQSHNTVAVGDKKPSIVTNSKEVKRDIPKITSSSIVSPAVSKSSISSIISTASSTVPVTLKSGLNSSPVILSSLPIGSTFMSVNNSLIPIATPSGTFLPTSLPPNIVLTPVVPSTNSTQKTISSVTNSVNASIPSIQSRITPSSTVAITVSSIVKEPVYSSSAVKQMSHIAVSNTMPISSASSHKTYSKKQSRLVPTTVSDRMSPLKNINKFMTSTPMKSNSILTSKNTHESEIELIKKNVASIINRLEDDVPSNKETSLNSNSSIFPTISVSSVSSPKSRSSARKRITTPKVKSFRVNDVTITPVLSSPGSTKVVDSQLNLAPISSTTITSQPKDSKNSGSLLFESSGDVYMLEPVENDAIQAKQRAELEISKRKIDRSVQVTEMSMPKSKIQRKRAAAFNEDSAVMLKVKCYQLEMKYLNVLADCKRLKVELTKEKLKNAELSGKQVPDINEEDIAPDTSRSKASEIMKEIEENFIEKSDAVIYTMTKTSVLRSLYEDLEHVCLENTELNKELENYRSHDKFYKSLKKKLFDEEF